MKDIISGLKRFIPCDKIKHLYVPQYETLKLELILKNVLSMPDAAQHFPEAKELCKIPKGWLCNITYSVVGETFAEWVRQRIVERNQRVTVKRDLNINIQP
jgi:hypothetical protein